MSSDTTFRLLSSAETAHVAAGGRDVGALLARAESADLRAFRRRLDDLRRADAAEFQRGFLAAIEMVMAGHERERARRENVDADVEVIRTRKHWAAALRAVQRGATLPGEISSAIDLPRSRVAELLTELEEAGFLIHGERSDHRDRRTRPRRLTPRARIALAELGEHEVAPVALVVASVIECMALLVTRRRDSRARLLEILAGNLGDAVGREALRALTDALRTASLATEQPDESIIAPTMEVQSLLDQMLRRALRGDTGFPAELELRSRERPLVLRVASQRDEWDLLVRKYGLDRVHVRRDDELSAGTLPVGYDALYECVPLVAVDRRTPSGKALISGAKTRAVIASPQEPVVPDFASIDIMRFVGEPQRVAA